MKTIKTNNWKKLTISFSLVAVLAALIQNCDGSDDGAVGNTDAADVAQAKNALAITFAAGDTASSVTGNLTLPTSGLNNVRVSWSSGDTTVIANNGMVTRPTGSNATVTLTATLTKGVVTETKTFDLTVLAEGGANQSRKIYADANQVGALLQIPLLAVRPYKISHSMGATLTLSFETTSSDGADGSQNFIRLGLTTSTAAFANMFVTFADDTYYDATAASEGSVLKFSVRSPASGGNNSINVKVIKFVSLSNVTASENSTVTFTADNSWQEVSLPLNVMTFPGATNDILRSISRITFSLTDTDNDATNGLGAQQVEIDEIRFEPITDQDAVSQAKNALAITFAAGDTASSVTNNLTLPTSVGSGVTVSWSSGDTTVITNNGMVTRPASSDASVTLTAALTRGAVTETRTFDLTVARSNSDTADVAQAKNALAVTFAAGDTASSVKGNLTLPASGLNNVTVSWVSDNTGVIATDGMVTRPGAAASYEVVTLTATLTKNAATATKDFKVIVIAEPTAATGTQTVLYGDYKVYADSTKYASLTQASLHATPFMEFNQPSRQQIPQNTSGDGAAGSMNYRDTALTTVGGANWGISLSGAGGGDNTNDTHYDATAAPSKLCVSLRSTAVGHVGVRLVDVNGSAAQTTYAVASFTANGIWEEVCLRLDTATFSQHGNILDAFDRIVFIYLDADDNADTTPDETQEIDVDEVVLLRLRVDELN